MSESRALLVSFRWSALVTSDSFVTCDYKYMYIVDIAGWQKLTPLFQILEIFWRHFRRREPTATKFGTDTQQM